MKQRAIIVLILCWLGWHLAIPVDLVKSDLGRHIKNGELICHGNWDVLYKNYYSYTNPQYPFINHHWLFGVFCYCCWHYFGFTGLSLIYLFIELLTFYIFFRSWQRHSSFTLACAFALLSFPLLSFRTGLRPEGISYLFCGIFWYLIDSYLQKRLKPPYLFIALSFLQIVWVNMHLFFIMGPFLAAFFWCQACVNRDKQQSDVLRILFLSLLGMCLINPSGIYGFLAPFCINKAYIYPIAENQSVLYFLKSNILVYRFASLYFLTSISILCAALFFVVRREGFKKYILIGSLTLVLSCAAMKAMRMIGIYSFFWIPLTTYVFSKWIEFETVKVRKNIEISLLIIGIVVSASVNFDCKQAPMLGIIPGSNDAAEFLKREKITGVIFNDYLTGSYLIFSLFPRHKVFVDQRMEAYPADFLKDTYEKMLWDEVFWQNQDKKYHFNAIFTTPEQNDWDYRFVSARLQDPLWALVFKNDEAIIFLKRNQQNKDIINHYEIHARITRNS